MKLPGYKLIDFGHGRKLELFGGRLIDRPSPAAERIEPVMPTRWPHADSRFGDHWDHVRPWDEPLRVDCDGFTMLCRPTPAGHMGLFPEQGDNWRWLRCPAPVRDAAALNLFAYTGAATMALATAGYRVTHVDAAGPNVESARQNALINRLDDAPIRYLVEDVGKYVNRELRRGRRYQTIVLDPPAYGHGPGGGAWRIERDLWPLLRICLQLLPEDGGRMLVTGHSPQISRREVRQWLAQQRLDRFSVTIDDSRLTLTDRAGRHLDAGWSVRCGWQPKDNGNNQSS